MLDTRCRQLSLCSDRRYSYTVCKSLRKFARCSKDKLWYARIRKSRCTRKSPRLVSALHKIAERYLPNPWSRPTGKYRKFVRRPGGHLCGSRTPASSLSCPVDPEIRARDQRSLQTLVEYIPREFPFSSPQLPRNYYFIGNLSSPCICPSNSYRSENPTVQVSGWSLLSQKFKTMVGREYTRHLVSVTSPVMTGESGNSELNFPPENAVTVRLIAKIFNINKLQDLLKNWN